METDPGTEDQLHWKQSKNQDDTDQITDNQFQDVCQSWGLISARRPLHLSIKLLSPDCQRGE